MIKGARERGGAQLVHLGGVREDLTEKWYLNKDVKVARGTRLLGLRWREARV